jgi:hypothetical protein
VNGLKSEDDKEEEEEGENEWKGGRRKSRWKIFTDISSFALL